MYRDVCYDTHLIPTDRPIDYSDITAIEVAAGQLVSGVNLRLPVSTSISGTLRDSYSNAPIANGPMQFSLYSPAGAVVATTTITTNASGAYSLQGLVAGTYYLQAGLSNHLAPNTAYTPRVYGGGECLPVCDFSSATAITVSDSGVSGVDFDLFPGFVVTGSVVDAQSGMGIPDVSINACDGFFFPGSGVVASSVTDAAGNYVISHVPGNGRIATLDAPAHINVIWRNEQAIRPADGCTGFGGATLHFTSADEVLHGIDFTLARAAAISGQVSDAAFPGTPLTSYVALYQYNGSAAFWRSTVKTDAKGRYTTVGVEPGTYYVAAYAEIFGDVCQFYQSAACAPVWYSGNPYPATYTGTTSIALSGTSVVPDVDFQLNVSIFGNGFE